MASQGLGLSRWTEKGASYRTIQRFFNTQLLWCELHWCLLRNHLMSEDDVYLLAGDEVVVTKAGKKTFGLDRFFSSLYGHPVKGLCFFSLSLVSVKRRHSYPLGCWQVVRSTEEQVVTKAKQEQVEEKPSSRRQKDAPKEARTAILDSHQG